MKLLRIRDYILLSLAIVGEGLEEVRTVGGLWSKALEFRYGFVPPNYKKTSYVSTVSRLLSTGNIERKVDKNGNLHLQLTSIGRKDFERRFPLIQLKSKKWDGSFMVVIFDIPEKEKDNRQMLRDKLIELGFGMLQESVWITPFHFEENLREYLVESKLQDQVFVLRVENMLVGNIKKLAGKIWKIDILTENYKKVIQRVNNLKDKKIKNINEVKKIWDLFLSTIRIDPFLPKELLNESILREEASKALKGLAI